MPFSPCWPFEPLYFMQKIPAMLEQIVVHTMSC